MSVIAMQTLCWLLAFESVMLMVHSAAANKLHQNYTDIQEQQQENIRILNKALTKGWRAFCDAPVDESVLSLYNGANPSDASVYVMTITNQSIELPISYMSELTDFDIDVKRPTLVYVNAFYTTQTYYSVNEHLILLQQTRRDLNIIIIDFAKSIQQLYYTIKHHAQMQSQFVFKVLNVLLQHGVAAQDITLAGHSVGAQIAALSARLLMEATTATKNIPTQKLGQLIAIDPAVMCSPKDLHVRANVSERVVVVHGEGESLFGVRAALGTIDIYLNGIGQMARHRQQPGCTTQLCSHMYPFLLFMEALVEGVIIPTVKCNSWTRFRYGECDYDDIVVLGLKYPKKAKGSYFCRTQANPPYTYMEYGLKNSRRLKRRL